MGGGGGGGGGCTGADWEATLGLVQQRGGGNRGFNSGGCLQLLRTALFTP